MSYIKVGNIKLNIDSTNEDAIKKALDKVGLKDAKNIEIIKLSIDARKKPDIKKIYTVGFETDKDIVSKDGAVVLNEKPSYKYEITGEEPLSKRPIVIGFGPAGMFASYLLAINGYKLIIIERGGRVEDRVRSVEKFWETNDLDFESNVQFGEGGAGTFSDGKLLWVAYHLHTDPTLPQIMKKEKKNLEQVVYLDLFLISMQVKGPIGAEHFLMWKLLW